MLAKLKKYLDPTDQIMFARYSSVDRTYCSNGRLPMAIYQAPICD